MSTIMKTLNFNFKSILKPAWLVMVAFLAFGLIACEDDDDNGGGGDDDIVLDGFYIQGEATSFTDLNEDAKMEVTKNEVIQEERSTLYETYITVKGSGGFNIVEVAGDEQMTYGPDNVSVVGEADRDVEEPQVDFKRGTYTETEETFSVSEDGLYHVALDTELNKIVIIPVKYWGLIGGATPGGWTEDTKLEYDAFDMSSLSFSATEVELRSGDWKLRYSGGWKAALDTTVELSSGDKGVKVNTNLGGSASSLEPGGDNITNDDPGMYTVTMDWSISDGYSANLERTGDLQLTDWTGVDLDIVGDGVSPDNDDAIEDTSGWSWGYALLADNEGDPTVDGDVYTWTWSQVILEADAGFKVRTENGEPAPENDMGFDVGFDAVDTDNSSDLIDDSDGNIIATEKDTFDIVTTIDAADADTKTVTITEWTE